MGLAILFTILFHKKEGEPIGNIAWIIGALVIGTAVGWVAAKKVKMTAMPQMVSMFNGMGGACAALISMMEFPHIPQELILRHGMLNGEALTIMLGMMIGSVSFSGSMIAFGKLDEKIGDIKTKTLRYINLFIPVAAAGHAGLYPGSARPAPDDLDLWFCRCWRSFME